MRQALFAAFTVLGLLLSVQTLPRRLSILPSFRQVALIVCHRHVTSCAQ
jgi:hypothetical protein